MPEIAPDVLEELSFKKGSVKKTALCHNLSPDDMKIAREAMAMIDYLAKKQQPEGRHV